MLDRDANHRGGEEETEEITTCGVERKEENEMIITLIDHNSKGVETMIKALGICRGNKCTRSSLDKALDAKPVPHMSVLEFGWVCLLVEGVSVKTRIQLERHRMFSRH